MNFRSIGFYPLLNFNGVSKKFSFHAYRICGDILRDCCFVYMVLFFFLRHNYTFHFVWVSCHFVMCSGLDLSQD